MTPEERVAARVAGRMKRQLERKTYSLDFIGDRWQPWEWYPAGSIKSRPKRGPFKSSLSVRLA